MVKRNYDDLIITVGALIIGLGLYNLLTTTRSYAVTPLPCAAACAPFKSSSPATYATCCKQHAANAPKPAAPKPKTASKTYPLTYKPQSTGALQQGQVKRVVDLLPGTAPVDFYKVRQPYTPPQNVTNYNYNYTLPSTPTNQTSTVPSGGSCGQIVEYENHNHGCRNEDAHPQTDASYEYGGLFQIPNANDQLTLEFQGLAHSGGNDRSGYKVAFNEGKSGVFMWKQIDTGYGKPIPPNGGGNDKYQAKIGSKVNIVIRKQDIGPASAPIGVEINAFAENQLVGRWRDMQNQPLRATAPYTGVKDGYRVGYRNDGLAGSTTSCPKGTTGPSVICGSISYRALPNLPS